MDKLKMAVVGVGGMGASHVRDIAASVDIELAAVCDASRERADELAARHSVPAYYSVDDLVESGTAEAVLIATPHRFHAQAAIAALRRGVHVLVEKPIAVHAKEALSMVRAFDEAKRSFPNLVFAAMFNLRTFDHWRKIKALIDGGDLGKLVRATWIVTDWFRTQYYYDTGGWRGTWAGEGGGVLLNQCPHNLDMYQWLFGMPARVHGFVGIGKYHAIEVEDEVTAYFEHENGMVGHFITTTAESPGTNRLEIVGDRGKIIYENDVITFYMNRRSMLDVLRDEQKAFTSVENWKVTVPFNDHGEPGHRLITENFAAAIRGDEELISPARDGVSSISLGNAIMLSSFRGETVRLPIDADAYAARLEEKVASSTFQKKVVKPVGEVDMSASFRK